MAIITEKDLQPTYDVIVVCSGAGGECDHRRGDRRGVAPVSGNA